MTAEEAFHRLACPQGSPQQVAQQLRQDDEPAVGPAPTLDQQGTEIRRRRAVGEALGVIVELPAAAYEVDARLGVLDPGPVQAKTRDRKAALPVRLSDVLQRDRKSTRLNSSHEWISYA